MTETTPSGTRPATPVPPLETTSSRWKTPAIILVTVLVLAVACHYAIQSIYQTPQEVTLATGTNGGRYREVMMELGDRLATKHGIKVNYAHTKGSFENIELLEKGVVDFALFQSGAQDHRLDHPTDNLLSQQTLKAVGNLYSEIVHILVRRDANISKLSDFRGKRISIGAKSSGDFVSAKIVIGHLGLRMDEFESLSIDYSEVAERFQSDRLDAAFVTVGLGAESIDTMVRGGNVDLVSLPFPDRLALRNLSVRRATIPAGMYQVEPRTIPAEKIETVAMQAQLLTHDGVSTALAEIVASTIMEQDFQRTLKLRELFESGSAFAQSETLFPLHDGAANHFDPELKPLLPPDFVEATEGLRSFIVSVLIAAYLGWRWFKQHRLRAHEHGLDRYIRELLHIEVLQMDLDEQDSTNDIERLQRLLDKVTMLRQQALADMSAHELTDDSAAPVFIQMCHALSDKINAKLSRQRMDVRLGELVEATQSGEANEVPDSDA